MLSFQKDSAIMIYTLKPNHKQIMLYQWNIVVVPLVQNVFIQYENIVIQISLPSAWL